jgi:predicted phage-related endonuclease
MGHIKRLRNKNKNIGEKKLIEKIISELEAEKKEIGESIINNLHKEEYRTAFSLYKDYRALQEYICFIKKYEDKTNHKQGKLFKNDMETSQQ